MKWLVSKFGESYKRTVKKIIRNSATLSKDTFRLNVATLLPSFGMTRRGAFHGLKIIGAAIKDPKHVLDVCWAQVGSELPALKEIIAENSFGQRSRAILELSPDSRNYIIESVSDLFEKLKWTDVSGSYVGRVGASKILFAVLPEICLPVDNAEWDHVFRTDDYHRVLLTMIDEINEWEAKANTRFESLDSPPTTLPSVYNVMAMAARPSADESLNHPRHSGSTHKNADVLERFDGDRSINRLTNRIANQKNVRNSHNIVQIATGERQDLLETIRLFLDLVESLQSFITEDELRIGLVHLNNRL